MAVTNEQISAYLAANPGMSDADVAAAMNQYGVMPDQMAQVTGLGQNVAQPQSGATGSPLSMQGIASTSGMGVTGIGLNNTANLGADLVGGDAVAASSDTGAAIAPGALSEAANTPGLGSTGIGLDTSYGALGDFLGMAGIRNAEENAARLADQNKQIQEMYTQYMGPGRVADQEGLNYWRQQFGPEIDDAERELFRQTAATNLTQQFGEGDAGLLGGFKYAKDLGVDNANLKSLLGDDLYGQYQGQLQNFATTNINDIVADNSLTFEESQKVANFARDLGFDSQQLADLTGKDKSLFDNILTSYDTNRNKIINDTLAGPNVLTDADKIVAAYALEKQFGFTDEDLAQATGLGVDAVQGMLNPVRNFETDFSTIANNTDSTTQQLKDFVFNARSNAAIDKLYGESLAGYENKIAELENKWSKYGSDAIQSENLFQQLNAQKEALGGQYFQGVFGDLENSAAQLVQKGLDTMGDLGQKEKFAPTTAEVRYSQNGVPVMSPDGVNFYKSVEVGDSMGYELVDPKDVQATYGKYVSGGNSEDAAVFQPLSEQELATLKDGTYQEKLGSVVIDKDTGQELTGLDGNLLYQRSGGHLTGKKHYLTANFTDEGVPYLTASQEKSGIYGFVSDLGPMVVSIASMIPGPHQPFAMAANAALAASQKNYLGAVLSGLGAYGTFTGNELASLNAAEASGDIINASQALDLQNTAANVKLAQTAVGGLAALKAENLPGVINASLSAYGQTGGTLPSGATTALQAVNLATALDADNIPAALTALGDLTGSKDMYVAASAKSLIDALESGNISNITQAGMVFANSFQAANQARETADTGGITNRITDDMTEAGAAAFSDAKRAGADDADALAAANAATGVVVNKIPDSESGGVIINPIDAGGPNLSTTTTYDQNVATVDTNFGDLQGAIETNAMNDAVRSDKLNVIQNTPNFNKAYADARELLGPGQVFPWFNPKTGKVESFSTATAAERPDLNITSGDLAIEALNAANLATTTDASKTIGAQTDATARIYGSAPDQSAAETARLRNLNTGLDLAKSEQAANDAKAAINSLLGEGTASTLVLQGLSNLQQAMGQTFDFFGGVGATTGLAGSDNTLTNIGQSLNRTGQALQHEAITTAGENVISAVDQAKGLGNKLVAGVKAIIENPLSINYAVVEAMQEAMPISMAAKIFSLAGKFSAIGANVAYNAMESGGAARNEAYRESIARNESEEVANANADRKFWIASTVTALTGAAVDTAVVNKVAKAMEKVATKSATTGAKEGGTEILEVLATEVLDVVASGGDLNDKTLDKIFTKTAVEGLVGGKTASTVDVTTGAGNVVTDIIQPGAATAAANTAAATNVANNINTAITSGDTQNIGSVITESVTTSLNSGANTNAVIDTAIATAITGGADASSTITNTVAAALGTGAAADTVINSAINSAITAGAGVGATVDSAIEAAVTGALTGVVNTGGDVTGAVEAAVGAAITNVANTGGGATGGDVTGAVETAVGAAVTTVTNNGGNVTGAVETAVGAAVTTVTNNGGDVTGAVETAVGSAVTNVTNNGGDVTGAVEAAVGAAVSNVTSTGGDVNGAIEAAVGAAVTNVVNSGGSVDAAVGAAVTGVVNSGGSVTVAVESAVKAVVESGGDVTGAVEGAVTGAVNSGGSVTGAVDSAVKTVVESGGSVTVAVESAVTAAVTAGASVDASLAAAVSSAVTAGGDVNTVIQAATDAAISTGNNVTVASDANTVTITNATTDTNTTVNTTTGVTTTVDNASNVTTVVDGNTTTVVDANASTTSQTKVEGDTQTTVVADAATNTNTETVVDAKTNTTTSTTVDSDSNTTTQTTITADTQTTVLTDINTNTQTTVKVDTNTGEIIDQNEAPIPDGWKPPVIEAPVVPPSVTPPTVTPPAVVPPADPAKETATVPKLNPKMAEEAKVGAGGLGLPVGMDLKPASLRSRETQKAIDPLARVKEMQAEFEREAMIQNVDPRLMQILQQRSDPQQQSQQFDKDIGALSKLLSGTPDAPSSNASNYYSYGSEDSIDDILGGAAANYKEGGFVEPLKASGGSMALPLLAKAGGALGHYKGRENFKEGKHVAGEGDGQSDDIPAWLADGEFVFPADVVSALGNGSTKAGTDKLYEMMHSIRDRARSKGPKDLPPPALKSPLDYLKSSKRSTS